MEERKIYKALVAVSAKVGAISKDKKNVQQNFMFRGIDQVMNALHPILNECGVFIVPEIMETHREERMTKSGGNLIYTVHKVRYHFTADDGSEVCAVVTGEGMDSADKSSNKAMAVAFKYACFQMFCIPTEELAKDDPDLYTQEQSYPPTTKSLVIGFLTAEGKKSETWRNMYLQKFGLGDVAELTDDNIIEIYNNMIFKGVLR